MFVICNNTYVINYLYLILESTYNTYYIIHPEFLLVLSLVIYIIVKYKNCVGTFCIKYKIYHLLFIIISKHYTKVSILNLNSEQ
jgi:hypothetical protein